MKISQSIDRWKCKGNLFYVICKVGLSESKHHIITCMPIFLQVDCIANVQ